MAAPDTAPGYKDAGPAAGDARPRKTHANAAPRDKTTTNTSDDDEADADAPYSSSPPDTAAIAVGDMDLRAQLELEKSRYPGAATWAPEEARLFELLFYRQDLPILPSHWDIDLRGVPISMTNFADAANPPVVYAHGKDFVASTALVRLIELTASIRTTSESGLHHRVPAMLKDGLDRFLAWAAEDGGYSHLRVVPNAIAEVIDTALLEGDITALLQGRMRALARLQRDYLRQDRDPNFWQGITTGATASRTKTEDDEGGDDDDAYGDRDSLLLQRYLSPRKDRLFNRTPRRGNGGPRRRRRLGSNAMEDELATTPDDQTSGADAAVSRRRRTFASPVSELDELAQPGGDSCLLSSPPSERTEASRRLQSSPATSPSSPATVQYRRRPPVVYGFFVLNSSIFVLTTDASRGENAYVSFHVETDFMEQGQCVWNALTLAIVACLARDDMRLRVDDFEPLAAEEESDPDA